MDNHMAAPLTFALGKATLAAGTGSSVSSTGTLAYAIRSLVYSHAAMSNTATPTTDAVTGLAFLPVKRGYMSVFVFGYNANGDLRVVQGGVVPTGGVAPQFPGLPNDFCSIGYLVISAGITADATTGWVLGTSNMAGVTGITYSFRDIIGIPDHPVLT